MGNYNQTYRMDMRAKVSRSSHKEQNDDIDIERLVWDLEYRELVKALLQPKRSSSTPFSLEALQ